MQLNWQGLTKWKTVSVISADTSDIGLVTINCLLHCRLFKEMGAVSKQRFNDRWTLCDGFYSTVPLRLSLPLHLTVCHQSGQTKWD